MTKRTDLHDVLDGLLIPGEEKVAGPDLSGLSLFELGALMGIKTASPELDKQAYGICGPYDGERWLEQFSGSPLYEKAIALAERELAVEQKAVAAREKRKQEFRIDDSTWREHDKLRLDKDKLILELHKHRAKEQARNMKVAEDVEYTGQVNNGIASNPEWPRAALGVDAAGRRATPEEKREQEKSVTPDVQHVQPQSDGGSFVTKGAHDEKLLGLFEKEAVSKEWVKRLSESGTLKRLSSAKPLAGPTQDLRNRVISKEVAHRTGADAARRSGGRHWWGGKKDPSRAQIVESLKLDRRADLRGAEAEGILQGQVKHERQRDAAHRVLQSSEKQSSLAAVGAALGRPF